MLPLGLRVESQGKDELLSRNRRYYSYLDQPAGIQDNKHRSERCTIESCICHDLKELS